MGEIIPFIARVRDGGDWSAAERARLDALAEQFAQAGVRVEVIYGVTDTGDPWCVIKDENEDVLLHVARIDGRFVVHESADDSLREASDLPAALGHQLALMDDPRGARGEVVVPFAAGGRQFQGLIALLVATAFVYDHREPQGVIALDVRAEPVDEPLHAPPPPEPTPDGDVREARHLAQVWAAAPEASAAATGSGAVAPMPEAAPASAGVEGAGTELKGESVTEAAPPPRAAAPPVDLTAPAAQVERPHLMLGTGGGDRLVGTAHADLIRGGAGDDTLSGGGAGPGQYDTLDGGAGNDRLLVDSHTIAIGGTGADTFVIEAPKLPDHPESFLGFILDFHPEEGDRIVGPHGDAAAFVHPDAAFLARFHPQAPPPGFGPASTSTVFVDLNGDGKPDGYLIVGHGTGGAAGGPDDKPPPPQEPESDPALTSVGRTLIHDPVGWATGG